MNFKKVKNQMLIVLTALSTIIYLTWRIFFTIPVGEDTFSLVWGIALLVVEVLGMFEACVHFKNMSNIESPEKPEISDEQYLDVDVFIATYNEPYELLYKTVNGCVNMDYPDKSKVHIYICDDSDRDEMKALAKEFGINYITRTDRKGAKAGNFNNALKHTNSPFVVTFDADMIPMRDFLMSTIPYFYLTEKVGFVQTPQSFYNPDLFQYNLFSENRIPNEQDYFYRDIQVSRNKSNSVIYGGSNTIISRKALEEAGGFYTESITEDFATGMIIESLGYRCYAIDEVHASGLSPSDLKTLIKQRDRWARGCIQAGKKLNILFRKGLSFAQKVSYITAISYWYACIKRLIYILSPILFAVFGFTIVKCNLIETVIFWLPMYILNSMSLKMLSNNIRSVKWTNVYETIMFPSLIPSVILETFGISKNVFSVTKKDGADDDTAYRVRCAIPHIILAVLSIIGIWNCISYMFTTGSIGSSVVLFWLCFNLYTILMSIFFMFGRKIFRNSERFYVETSCIVTQGNYEISCKTKDISETGFAIILDKPEYIDYHKEHKVKIKTDKYETEFTAFIVHVDDFNGRWKYAFAIEEISDENKRNYLHIIYDREPTLPKVIENHNSVFDDLRINIMKRGKKTIHFNRKLPRVQLLKKLRTTDGMEVVLKNLNYEYVLIAGTTSEKVTLDLGHNIFMKCTLSKVIGDEILYAIDNFEELNSNEIFMKKIQSYISEYDEYIKAEKERQRLERKRAPKDEFNEALYI